ncbi:MAG TPA: hypothetical protein VNS55_04110 [Nocardioides sp.]|nr:hypothetical protein [Nocardioides sp.]
MRIARSIGTAVAVLTALFPATAAAAQPSLPEPPAPAPAPVAPEPLAAPVACTYVVESGIFSCDATAMSRLAQATTVVATLFPAKGFASAPTLTVRTEKDGCTSGKLRSELRVDLRYLYFVDGQHWDDEAMSFRTYNGCRLKLFDGSDGKEGRMAPTGWLDDTGNMASIGGRNWGRRVDLLAVS